MYIIKMFSPMGKLLFTYTAKIELPRENTTMNFELKSTEVTKAVAGNPH